MPKPKDIQSRNCILLLVMKKMSVVKQMPRRFLLTLVIHKVQENIYKAVHAQYYSDETREFVNYALSARVQSRLHCKLCGQINQNDFKQAGAELELVSS